MCAFNKNELFCISMLNGKIMYVNSIFSYYTFNK